VAKTTQISSECVQVKAKISGHVMKLTVFWDVMCGAFITNIFVKFNVKRFYKD
jgi:hypothetical protein